jgi:hypothetical protein
MTTRTKSIEDATISGHYIITTDCVGGDWFYSLNDNRSSYVGPFDRRETAIAQAEVAISRHRHPGDCCVSSIRVEGWQIPV